jgi:PAS domain S-box-containing protein
MREEKSRSESTERKLASSRVMTLGRRPTLGCLPLMLNGDGSDIWAGVESVAKQLDANLICFALAEPESHVFFHLINHESVDGLVISAGSLIASFGNALISSFCSRNQFLPKISIGQQLRGIPSLFIDNYGGMRAVLLHLIEKHHIERIAFIRGPEQSWEARERWRAYRDVLNQKGIPFDSGLVTPPAPSWDDPDTDWGAQVLLFQRKLQPGIDFQAVAAAIDWEAIGMLRTLQFQGFVVPRDVALVGFNDDPRSQNLIPALTTVPVSGYEQGKLATKTLFALLRGEEISEQVLIPAQVIIRESCGCLPEVVSQAAVGTAFRENLLEPEQIAEKRQEIHQALIEPFGDVADQMSAGVLELLDAFLEEVSGAPVKRFLPILADLLRQTQATENNLEIWQTVISTLRRTSLPFLVGEALGRASDLWEQARVVLSDIAGRQQLTLTRAAELKMAALSSANQALMANPDFNGIFTTLVNQVARLGIRSCYLSLFDDPANPENTARLVFACNKRGRIELPAGGVSLPAGSLVPTEFLPDHRRFSLIAAALNFQNVNLGIVYFELGPQDWYIYNSLRKTLSSVLFKARQVEQIQRRAARLHSAADVLQVTNSIVDPDELVTAAVELLQSQFSLYFAGLYLVEQADQKIVFKAGLGEAGKAIYENGHRLEINDTSMIGWCISHKQTRYAGDVSQDPLHLENAQLPETRSVMVLPLISRDQVIGALSIHSTQRNAFDEEDIALFQTLANQLAIAIFSAQAHAQVDLETVDRQRSKERHGDESIATAPVAHHPAATVTDELRLSSGLKEHSLEEFGQAADLQGRANEVPDGEQAQFALEPLGVEPIRRDDYFEVAAEITRIFVGEQDPDSFIPQITGILQERFNFIYAGVFLIEQIDEWTGERGKYIAQHSGAIANGKILSEHELRLEIGDDSLIGLCVANKEMRSAVNVKPDDKSIRNFPLPETYTELAIPLVNRGEAYGALSILASKSTPISTAVVSVLQLTADLLANALANVQSIQHLSREQVLLNALLDNLPDSIYFKDLQSRFIRNSRSHAITLGVGDPSKLLGKTDFDFFTAKHAQAAFTDEQDILRSGQPKLNIEERETWPNRPDTWVLTSKIPLRDQRGQVIGTFGISKDISAMKRVEMERELLLKEVSRRAMQIETASDVARAASSILNPDELFQQTVNLLHDRFDLYYAGIYLVDATGQTAVLRAGTGEAGKKLLNEGWRLPVGGESMIGRCIARGQADIQLDIEKATVYLRNPYLLETRTEMALPLISRGHALGALTIQSDKPNAFSREDIAIFQTLADQLSNAIDNARLLEQTRQQIQERKLTDETLAQERSLLRTLIDHLPDRIYVKDTHGRFLIANQSVARHVGLVSPEALVGKSDFDLYPRAYAAQYRADEMLLLQTKKALVDREELSQDAQGNQGWTLTSKIPLIDSQGNAIGLVGIGRDITERKQTEQERERLLREMQHRALQLQTAAEVSQAASSLLDPGQLLSQTVDLLKERFNLYYAGLFLVDETGQWAVLKAGTGEAGRQLLAQNWRILVGSASMIGRCIARGRADIQQDIEKATVFLRNPLLPETRSEMALPLISRGQTIGALSIQSTEKEAFSNEDVAILQTLADQLANSLENARLFEQIRREIEVRRLAEKALDQERTLLRTLIDNLPDLIYVKDTDGRYLLNNQADIRWMGVQSFDEIVGKTDFDFYPTELAEKIQADDLSVIQANATVEKEEMSFNAHGETRWTLTTKLPLRSTTGEWIGLLGIGRDITGVKTVEQRVAQERNLLRTLIDNLPDVIYYKDTASRMLIANTAQARLLGAESPDELIGKTDFDYFKKELAEKYFADERLLLQTGEPLINIEEVTVDTTGNEHWLMTTKLPLRNQDGEVMGLVGIGRDITERKKNEQEREHLLEEMQRRTLQLQGAAEVARAVGSLLEPEELIRQVVNLVRDRFNLYFAGLYLVDPHGRWAVLKAGTGEAGREMLARNWRLEIGGSSMIGLCIANSRADIQMDVRQAPVHLRNPYLPETRSEMALPLISRGRTIGALTIQSAQAQAFSEADITILLTMTSQIANAIENARLFEQTQSALAELEAIQRRYTLQAWKEYTGSRPIKGYQQSASICVPLESELSPTSLEAIQNQTVIIDADQTDAPTLVVPVMLRDQPIGAWGVKAQPGKHTWTADEVSLIQEISEQFALAADTLRLLDETQRRAARERLVTEITMKMRATNDPETILKTALSELRQALQANQAQALLVSKEKKSSE